PTPIVQDIMPAEPIVSVQPEEPQSILDVKEPPIPSSVMVVYDESPNKKVSEESPLPVAGLDPRLSKAMDAIHATSDDTEVIMCDLGALEPHEKERFYSQLEQAMPSEEALRDIFML
ncbi:MAG: hypothetical protein L3J79_06745, partial [Candidatus Marinimicrobia bacterium]|nr:hypothetical protein [Candidatus Neomarinimicrobiota bacterium]